MLNEPNSSAWVVFRWIYELAIALLKTALFIGFTLIIVGIVLGPLYVLISKNLIPANLSVAIYVAWGFWAIFVIATVGLLVRKFSTPGASGFVSNENSLESGDFLNESTGPIYHSAKNDRVHVPYTREHFLRYGTRNVMSDD